MSAHVVNDITIDRIVPALVKDPKKLENAAGTEIGRRLLRSNEQAVALRYGERPNQGASVAYRYRPQSCSDIQTYKSMDAWLSNTGHGEDQTLRDQVKAAQAEVARRIIWATPEYKAARYDG